MSTTDEWMPLQDFLEMVDAPKEPKETNDNEPTKKIPKSALLSDPWLAALFGLDKQQGLKPPASRPAGAAGKGQSASGSAAASGQPAPLEPVDKATLDALLQAKREEMGDKILREAKGPWSESVGQDKRHAVGTDTGGLKWQSQTQQSEAKTFAKAFSMQMSAQFAFSQVGSEQAALSLAKEFSDMMNHYYKIYEKKGSKLTFNFEFPRDLWSPSAAFETFALAQTKSEFHKRAAWLRGLRPRNL